MAGARQQGSGQSGAILQRTSGQSARRRLSGRRRRQPYLSDRGTVPGAEEQTFHLAHRIQLHGLLRARGHRRATGESRPAGGGHRRRRRLPDDLHGGADRHGTETAHRLLRIPRRRAVADRPSPATALQPQGLLGAAGLPDPRHRRSHRRGVLFNENRSGHHPGYRRGLADVRIGPAGDRGREYRLLQGHALHQRLHANQSQAHARRDETAPDGSRRVTAPEPTERSGNPRYIPVSRQAVFQ